MTRNHEKADPEPDGIRHRISLGYVFSVVSVALLGFVALSYLGRFDRCAAVTIFPAWVWLIPGLSLAALQWRLGNRRVGATLAVMWLAFAVLFADTRMSLLRGLRRWASSSGSAETHKVGDAIRVVTLNCATSARAASEVTECRPDIVLLQESPNRDDLRALSRQLYGGEGSVLWGPDASIIARGRITPVDIPSSLRGVIVCARIRLASGSEIAVIGLRLLPSPFRLDLWSPECWNDYTDNRRKRRNQLLAIVQETKAIPVETPLILGGDFNVPPDDAVFRLLRRV